MKKLIFSTLLAAAVAAPVMAQQKADDHSAHHPASPAAPAMTDGEVRKVDRSAAKITIKHGEIKSLDMPPMTMVFQVKDATLLDKVKAGDRVRFAVEDTAGKLVVTEILLAP